MFAAFITIVYRAPLIIVATMLMGSCSLAVMPFDKGGRMQLWCARVWARMLCRLMGIRVTVEGLEKLDLSRNYIFVSNHLSYADTPVLLSKISSNFRFMARAGLFRIPFLGHHLRTAGHIPVETENPRDAVRSMNDAGKTVREMGISLLIFPEGGRSNGVFGQFKGGAAFVAIKAGVPVVPLGLIGTRQIMPRDSKVIHSGNVRIRIGDPIPVEGLTLKDRESFTAQLRSSVAQLLEP